MVLESALGINKYPKNMFSGNLIGSLCDLNFCFGKGDIYQFIMPAVA